ncbi:hypothetical protein ACO0K9_04275 [Undibacterium sp. Ji50W]|uniref:hypothetical protein n=1 Tax=Undibacterium sp. Ji50W TaxID=3413041 RepID=UPI003BF2C3FE
MQSLHTIYPVSQLRLLFSPLLISIVLLLSACSSGPTIPPAQIQLAADEGEVTILWSAIPRPPPLPPLEHAAMLVPVHFAGAEGKVFYMQFDLGHPSTIVYSNKWKSIAEKYRIPYSADKIASLNFTLGNMQVNARNVGIMPREGAGVNWGDDSIELLGTIGADLIDGRVVALDFKKNLIQLARKRDALVGAGTQFVPFSFSGRRILMPVHFDGADKTVMYDSGSSAFAWLSNEKTFQRLARKDAVPISYPIRSWDKILTAHTVASDATVKIAGLTLPIREISYIQDMGLLQELAISSLGVGGMVGNKLFLGKKLIIDTRKLEIGIED